VLLAATDVDIPMGVPGLSLHEELVRLVEAGLTPLEALQAATLNPARVLGLADSLGRIEPGKLADLVLLDANPLENIRNTQKIGAVVADGQLYRRSDLDRLLAQVEALNHKVEKRREGVKARHNTLLHLLRDPQMNSWPLGHDSAPLFMSHASRTRAPAGYGVGP
jgi:adenine deaminase